MTASLGLAVVHYQVPDGYEVLCLTKGSCTAQEGQQRQGRPTTSAQERKFTSSLLTVNSNMFRP